MDFELTQEQTMFREMAHKFAEQEILPYLREYEREEKYFESVVEKAKEVGLIGPHIPEKYGGLGLGRVTLAVILEELCWASYSVAHNFLGGPVLPGTIILMAGNEEQRQRWLPPMCRGELFACGAAVEPNAGSDASNIETSAVKSGNKWIINGTKLFITDGGKADMALVLAQTDKSKGPKGLGIFAVQRGTPGFSSKDLVGKLAWRAGNLADLRFSDCEVPEENVIGEVGKGLRNMFHGIDVARLFITMGSVGMSRSCLESVVKYAKERKQFGKPIGSFQLIQGVVADMAAAIDAVRLQGLRLAWLMDKKAPHILESSYAKYQAMKLVKWVTSEAVRVFGAYGIMDEYPVEHHHRDALTTNMMGGTPEMHALTIGRQLLDIDAMGG
jgi:alkylation response protein AidB-like acyl-CoA dehydrogenase